MSDELPAVPVEETPAATETPAFSAKYDRESLTANLPEGMDAESFGKYLDKTDDPYVAFKSYSNLEKMKSKGLPNASWEDADHAALDTARGVPADAAGYTFGEGVTLDDDSSALIKAFAADSKMTPAQADKAATLLQTVRETEAAQLQEKQDQAANNMTNFLVDEWGHQDSQSFDNNWKLVNGVLDSIGVKEGSDEANAIWSGPPQVVKLLKEYGDMLDPGITASFGSGDTKTPSSLTQEMDKLSSQMYSPGMDFNSAAFKDMDAKLDRLAAQRDRAER